MSTKPETTLFRSKATGPFAIHDIFRIWFFLTGFVGPLVCFAFSLGGARPSIDEPYQSGLLRDYVILLLAFPTMFWFLPLLVPSMASLAILVARPERISSWWVRLGIYSGAIASFSFMLLVHVPAGPIPLILAFAGTFLAFLPLTLIVWAVWKVFRLKSIAKAVVSTAIILSTLILPNLILASRESTNDFLESVTVTPLFLVCGGTPWLNFFTYSILAIRLAWREPEYRSQTPRMIQGAIASAVLWLITWRQALLTMHAEYLKLPTENPKCFVSAAAAYGHNALVGSWQAGAECTPVPINRQMQYLKFLEIAIAAASPRCHRAIRRTYNRCGPRIARWIRHSPWRADVAWLALLPLMAMAMALRAAIRFPATDVHCLYLHKVEICTKLAGSTETQRR